MQPGVDRRCQTKVAAPFEQPTPDRRPISDAIDDEQHWRHGDGDDQEVDPPQTAVEHELRVIRAVVHEPIGERPRRVEHDRVEKEHGIEDARHARAARVIAIHSPITGLVAANDMAHGFVTDQLNSELSCPLRIHLKMSA